MQIFRNVNFSDPQRAEVEALAVEAVHSDTAGLMERYDRHMGSLGGRYINSDLCKELLPEYGKSKHHRTVFNVAVHHPAAALSNALYQRAVRKPDVEGRRKVLFITGSPGAGKTTAVFRPSFEAIGYKVVYEGQLSTPDLALEKLQSCLDAGCEPEILVIHPKPETALDNTFARFAAIGRGASVNTMATIQGNLPNSLTKIRDALGDKVLLRVCDFARQTYFASGWHTISALHSEGDYHAIKERLSAHLERRFAEGAISEPCYREAAGQPPFRLSELQDMDRRCTEKC